MRIVTGISAMALAALASNMAIARTVSGGPAPVAEQVTAVDAKVSKDFRVRADILTTSTRIDPFGDPDGPMRHRFASSMIDYYPLGGGSGLRISGGMRFFSVANFYKDAERATGGLLFVPRQPGGTAGGVRTGFSRRTPAATVGYTGTFRNAVFGIEVGSLIGNANYNLPRSFARVSNRAAGGVNPIANVVFGFRF